MDKKRWKQFYKSEIIIIIYMNGPISVASFLHASCQNRFYFGGFQFFPVIDDNGTELCSRPWRAQVQGFWTLGPSTTHIQHPPSTHPSIQTYYHPKLKPLTHWITVIGHDGCYYPNWVRGTRENYKGFICFLRFILSPTDPCGYLWTSQSWSTH